MVLVEFPAARESQAAVAIILFMRACCPALVRLKLPGNAIRRSGGWIVARAAVSMRVIEATAGGGTRTWL